MDYYIRHRQYTSAINGRIHRSQMLVELTAAEARECVHASPASDEPDYQRCSADYARNWVRQGLPHETPLWVDYDNRVRYARDSY